MRGVIRRASVLTLLAGLGTLVPLQRAVNQPMSAEVLLALGLAVVMVYGAIITVRRSAAPFAAAVFAFGVGITLGSVSAYLAREVGGLFAVASLAGLATLMVTLWLYGIVMEGRRSTRFIASHLVVGSVVMLSCAAMVVQPYIFRVAFDSGQPAAAFVVSLVVIGLATYCFIIDCEQVQSCIEAGAPKHLEWYCAVGLLMTLIWMPVEALRVVTRAHVRVQNGSTAKFGPAHTATHTESVDGPDDADDADDAGA